MGEETVGLVATARSVVLSSCIVVLCFVFSLRVADEAARWV
jgi:hypothetical protein